MLQIQNLPAPEEVPLPSHYDPFTTRASPSPLAYSKSKRTETEYKVAARCIDVKSTRTRRNEVFERRGVTSFRGGDRMSAGPPSAHPSAPPSSTRLSPWTRAGGREKEEGGRSGKRRRGLGRAMGSSSRSTFSSTEKPWSDHRLQR